MGDELLKAEEIRTLFSIQKTFLHNLNKEHFNFNRSIKEWLHLSNFFYLGSINPLINLSFRVA